MSNFISQAIKIAVISRMPQAYRFRLGAILALRPGPAMQPNGTRKPIVGMKPAKACPWLHVEHSPRSGMMGAHFVGYQYTDKFYPISRAGAV